MEVAVGTVGNVKVLPLEDALRQDVPGLVTKYWRKPSSFEARPSAAKRGSRGGSRPAVPARAVRASGVPLRRNPRRGLAA